MASNALEASFTPPPVPAEWRQVDQDTLRPSHVSLPPAFSAGAFRTPPPWRALLGAAIVALAGVIWLVARSATSEPDAVAALQPGPATVTPSRAPAASVLPRAAVRPPPKAEAVATPVTSGDRSGLAESVKAALSGTDPSVPVTVHVSPSDAVVFKAGQRLGAGEVTVNVTPGKKTTLVAQLRGYLPRTIAVDASNKTVNIVLSRPPSASAREPIGASKNTNTSTRDVPSGSTSASDSEPSEPSPPESDPIGDVDPL
jgi:hypothetical protein